MQSHYLLLDKPLYTTKYTTRYCYIHYQILLYTATRYYYILLPDTTIYFYISHYILLYTLPDTAIHTTRYCYILLHKPLYILLHKPPYEAGLLRIKTFLLAHQFALLRLGQPRHRSLNRLRGKQIIEKLNLKKNRLCHPRHQSLNSMNDKDEDLEENKHNNKIKQT